MIGEHKFVIRPGNAQLVQTVLVAKLATGDLPEGHRRYYAALVHEAEAFGETPPDDGVRVVICAWTGLVFETTRPRSTKSPFADELLSHASRQIRVDGHDGQYQAAVRAIRECYAEGVVNPNTIRQRYWVAVRAAKREHRRQRTRRAVNATIVIDDREHNAAIADYLRERGIETDVQRCDAGDYLFVGGPITWGCERKEWFEFVEAVKSGDLSRQLANMLQDDQFDVCYLLVIGRPWSGIYSNAGLPPDALDGYLAKLTLFGVQPWFVANHEQAADWLTALARNAAKEDQPLAVRTRKPRVREGWQHLFYLTGLPGVSREIGLRLLDAFGGLSGEVFAAARDPDLLKGVPGIGLERAWRIHEALFQKPFESGSRPDEN